MESTREGRGSKGLGEKDIGPSQKWGFFLGWNLDSTGYMKRTNITFRSQSPDAFVRLFDRNTTGMRWIRADVILTSIKYVYLPGNSGGWYFRD